VTDIAETKVEKKERLRTSQLLLRDLNQEVEDCLDVGKPLSEKAYKQLVAISGTTNFDGQMLALEHFIEKTDEELQAVWTDLAKTSYHHFYEWMARNDGDDERGYTMSSHQRLIGDLLMASASKETMRFMLSMPPGHCKSTHSSHHFPAWWIGRNPRRIFLQAGHSQDFVSNELGAKVKSIIDAEDYTAVFDNIKVRSDMRAKDYWGLTNKKGKYVAKGAGQGISGFRGHYGMVDDPYKSREDAESAVIREKVFKWYSDDFSTRLLPGSPLGIIMTRWHSDDLCGRISEREAKELLERQEKAEKALLENIEQNETHRGRYRFEIINLPAIAEDADDILGRAVGEPLWPEVFDLDALENLRADMTSPSWNSLYQGTPIDISGGTVSASWFKRYGTDDVKLPSKTDAGTTIRRTVVSVDAANTAKERSDYTVITVWIEDMHKNHFLVDVVRKQIELTELISEIDRVCKRYDADALLVEAKGNGLAYIQLKQTGGAPCSLIPIEVGQASKEFRFDEVSPMFEAGQVWLPVRASWLPDYEKELIGFPSAKHDDQVDSTSQYLKWARVKARRGTKKMKGTSNA
jgi:predicted phage terminase large subunit-like protein